MGCPIQGNAGRHYLFAGWYRIGAMLDIDMKYPIHVLKIGTESRPAYGGGAEQFEPEAAVFAALQWVISCPLELYLMKLGTQCVDVKEDRLREISKRMVDGFMNQQIERQVDYFQSIPVRDCPAYARLRYDCLEQSLNNIDFEGLRPLAAQALEQLRIVEEGWGKLKEVVQKTFNLFDQGVQAKDRWAKNNDRLSSVFWAVGHDVLSGIREVQCKLLTSTPTKWSVSANSV